MLLFLLSSRYGLFVYPTYEPPWDHSTSPTVFQNFRVWGSAGGAQVKNFLTFVYSDYFLAGVIVNNKSHRALQVGKILSSSGALSPTYLDINYEIL